MRCWNVQEGCLEIERMPFYWRLSNWPNEVAGIRSQLGIRISCHPINDYLQFLPNASEWQVMDTAYRQNENIGFVNPESGQLHTYGSSVNNFFLSVIKDRDPKNIYEIGCGAGFTIQFLRENGWIVTGIDPSEYSLRWSNRLGFPLINSFFDGDLIRDSAQLIYCNDVFEHIIDVEEFSANVYQSLKVGGVFCFATTNSHRSIELGDISMLEHQHVNMFTARSIFLILHAAGFSEIYVGKGAYGNTFHVVAVKGAGLFNGDIPLAACDGYFERARHRIDAFGKFYGAQEGRCRFYVPLRCIPYLATVGDFGESDVFDSNLSWQGKYIDGYSRPIKSIPDIDKQEGSSFFIGSLTFYEEIRIMLQSKNFLPMEVFSILSI
jgi:SAM-dependent methyltransferase